MTPIMPERKTTMMSELTIENQWIDVFSADCRYESHRDAHLSADGRKATEYVYLQVCERRGVSGSACG